MAKLASFCDLLEERRQENSNFMWVSRALKTATSYTQSPKPSPKWHKEQVLESRKIQEIIRKFSEDNNGSNEEIKRQIWEILNEVGYNKRLAIIRWLGLVLTKICLSVCKGIYVNVDGIIRLKQMMGKTPVIFLPSHRSYADFILMSYVCFCHNIEIPAIAAGMDFHGMWGMGTVLRDTGAFFMRRSFNDDSLYWETFRQYIQQIVTKGDLPLEFFIEGTRSRSGKSLAPKLGLLSMILKAFFTCEVPDILFVPVNISYDRVLEEKLFAYELLGVPKPKETTSGFFKSLRIIKENYGKIYLNFAEPISARDYFKSSLDRSVHSLKPLHMQELTLNEKNLTLHLAYDIIHIQQKSCILTAFNLIALILTNNFASGKQTIHHKELVQDVLWLKHLLEVLGASTNLQDVKNDVKEACDVHKNLVHLKIDNTIELVQNTLQSSGVPEGKLKGHVLTQETMAYVLPFVMLQIYTNPVLHYLINPGLLIVVLNKCKELSKDTLFGHYGFLRSLFSHEFVTNERQEYLLDDSLQQLHTLELVTSTHDDISLTNNKPRLIMFFLNILEPFLFTYYVVCEILRRNTASNYKETCIIRAVQAQLKLMIDESKHFINPYCLSLDTITICLGSLTALSVLKRNKINGDVYCTVEGALIVSIIEKLDLYLQPKLKEEDFKFTQIETYLESKL